MPTAYINIGSNIGDRRSNIDRAVAAIVALGENPRVSTPIETEPWGFESANRFLNTGLAIDVDLAPLELLDALQQIERSISPTAHRNPDGSYRDRIVDIDIIAIDNLNLDTPRLILPHPRMHLRDFVLIPLAEIAPEWRHPATGLTATEMLKTCRRAMEM